MATGYTDAHGFYHYGEDDAAAPGGEFSAMLNMAADAIPVGVASLVDEKVLELAADPNDALVKALIEDDTTPSQTRTALDGILEPLDDRVHALESPPLLRMVRSSATPTITTGGIRSVAGDTNWVQAERVGFATYTSGIVIPASGVYRISYGLFLTGGAGFSGVTINSAAPVSDSELKIYRANASIGGGTQQITPNGAEDMTLAAGDVLRLFLVPLAGLTLVADQGFFAAERVR
ncbi:MAG TPA: hypothetical protein VNQ48_00180 [Microbacteriaceae bacterium]|nr:hypothetical protein [Microbacteriaceae bacterium]